jgi:hypothetical protein
MRVTLAVATLALLSVSCDRRMEGCGDASAGDSLCECVQACLALNPCGCSEQNQAGCVLSSECADFTCPDAVMVRCVLDAKDCAARLACLSSGTQTDAVEAETATDASAEACFQACNVLVACGGFPQGADCATAQCKADTAECVLAAKDCVTAIACNSGG